MKMLFPPLVGGLLLTSVLAGQTAKPESRGLNMNAYVDQLRSDLSRIGDQFLGAMKTYTADYDNMTPEVADRLAAKLLDAERQRNDLKKKYLKTITVTDAITAMRFLQVENQLEQLIDLQIASELPVIEGHGGELL
jgi:hypothetical protein